MKINLILYIIFALTAGANVTLSIINNNFSSTMGWICAIWFATMYLFKTLKE